MASSVPKAAARWSGVSAFVLQSRMKSPVFSIGSGRGIRIRATRQEQLQDEVVGGVDWLYTGPSGAASPLCLAADGSTRHRAQSGTDRAASETMKCRLIQTEVLLRATRETRPE